MAKNPKITKKQIKREITAREAAKNLEAFGYTGGPQWASIDNFIKANPRARAAVTANKGAFVQSEALGFSNGGFASYDQKKIDDFIAKQQQEAQKQQEYLSKHFEEEGVTKTFINDSGTLVKEKADGSYTKYGAAGNVVEFDTQGNLISNVQGGHTLGTGATKTGTVDLSEDQQAKLSQLFVNPKLTNRPRDSVGGSRDNKTALDYKYQVGGRGILRNRGDRVAQLVNQGANVYINDDGNVILQTPDGAEAKLDYGAAMTAFQQGLITGGKATYGAAEEETKEEDTTPEDTTPAPPVMSTPMQSAPAADMPTAISLEPSQAEIDRAAEIFTSDGRVVLPTGSSNLPSIQTPTVEAPEGTTAVDAPTFEANVQKQAKDFEQRGIDQAQLIQPQTRAEKIAAGQTAGKLEQRLYQNRQGMSTYILGVYNSEGVWTPSQPIPQGYRAANVGLAPYLVQQAASVPTTATPTTTDVKLDPMGEQPMPRGKGDIFPDPDPNEKGQDLVPRWSQPQKYFGRTLPPGTYAGPLDGIHKFGEGPYAEETSAYLRSIGKTLEEFIASANWEATPTPELTGDPSFAITKNQGGMVRGFTNGGVPEDPNEEDETNPTVTVAGQQLDRGQVAQGQADLKAGAYLDPAGTAVATPVSQINPDTEGAVLGAATGQALTTAPIITDPAQVGQTITADTPDKPAVSTITTQKAQPAVTTALQDVTGATSTGPTQTITGQTQDTTKVSDIDAAQGTAAKAVAAKRELQKGELITDYPDIDASTVDKDQVSEAFGTGEVKAASMQDELTTLMDQFEGGNTPPWAAGAMRKATAVMAQRGLGASSMAGQAIIQAAMEASLPIAQIDTANKQQVALFKGEQRAKFMQIEFDQNFQAKIINASKVSEIANMNFTAEQQVALENAKMAQTVNLANLNNRQALVMAEAAQISQLEMASLSNRQQAQVQNAQNFLQIDMANLNNEQQAEIFKAQTIANTILSDTAAANASEQFNASSENQTEQFFASMKSQISQFNSAQTNAMSQFNAGEANAVQKFNSELQNQREIFNAQMYAQIAQANAKWRQDTTTINTAAANQSNFQFAKDVNGLTNKAIDQIWQRERDLMSFAMQSSESAMDRSLQIIMGDKELQMVREKLDAEESAARGSLFTRFLFGSGVEGGFGGILKNIPFLN